MPNNLIQLESSRLRVDIAQPGALYEGSRFDHSANVVQVTLDGEHTFCGTEKLKHNSQYGFGLLNEFDPEHPPAYQEASINENFLKIGVGDLRKTTDAAYEFFHPYSFEEAKIDIEDQSKHSVIFELKSTRIKGSQYFLSKKVSVQENTLTLSYKLTNLGKNTLDFSEYCHNFLNIDGRKIDDSYALNFKTEVDADFFVKLVNPQETLNVNGSSISWNNTPNSDFFIEGVNKNSSKCQSWTLSNSKSGVGVSETLDYPCSKVNLWGVGHVVSPELFVNAAINPGNNLAWERRYRFFNL